MLYKNFEGRYYPRTLLAHIKKERRAVQVKETAVNYLVSLNKRRKCTAFLFWKNKMVRRQRLRELIKKIIQRYVETSTRYAYNIMLQRAIEMVAMVELQRFGRGFVTRLRLRVHYFATIIQTQCRGMIGRKLFSAITYKRKWAATEIQRRARGNSARRLAFNKLTTYIEQEYENLVKEREKWKQNQDNRAARAIQKAFKRKQKWKKEQNELERRTREASVQKEMEKAKEDYLKERKVYETQLEEFFRNMRLSWEENNILIKRTHSEGIKLRTLRRKLVNEEKKRKEEEAKDALKKSEEEALQQWIEDWNKNCEAKINNYKDYCKKCIENPDTLSEKKIGKELKERIKVRCVLETQGYNIGNFFIFIFSHIYHLHHPKKDRKVYWNVLIPKERKWKLLKP